MAVNGMITFNHLAQENMIAGENLVAGNVVHLIGNRVFVLKADEAQNGTIAGIVEQDYQQGETVPQFLVRGGPFPVDMPDEDYFYKVEREK